MTRTLITAIFLTLFSQTAWASEKHHLPTKMCDRIYEGVFISMSRWGFLREKLPPLKKKCEDNTETCLAPFFSATYFVVL